MLNSESTYSELNKLNSAILNPKTRSFPSQGKSTEFKFKLRVGWTFLLKRAPDATEVTQMYVLAVWTNWIIIFLFYWKKWNRSWDIRG